MPQVVEVKVGETHVALTAAPRAVESLGDAATSLPPQTWGVIPLGRCGRLLWNNLPFELARWVAEPTHYAIWIVPHEVASAATSLWEHVVGLNVEQIQILPGLADEQVPLPSLAPHRALKIPSPVRVGFREWQVPNAKSQEDAQAVRAGILQFWDELNRSHEYSQSIEGEGRHVAGDFWHGIMHRREPDYHNSKYWFRRVGQHPVFPELAEQAATILANTTEAADWSHRLTRGGWDSFAFVDLCQRAARDEDSPLGIAARQIQLTEMLLLLNSTWHDAVA
ncbi:MAG: hypothetical protein KDA58_04020 [Planctomycetaceae bacterium]|nr:hypothetical protein [Planctomycetaceae bacterium]